MSKYFGGFYCKRWFIGLKSLAVICNVKFKNKISVSVLPKTDICIFLFVCYEV